MLFGYPVEATAENWFHECLIEILETIHSCLRNGQVLPAWPEIIPNPHREILRNRRGLKDRLIDYQTVVATLTADELDKVNSALGEQNEIERLLSCQCKCAAINDLPIAIREPVKNLFEFGFGLLTDLGIRDQHYSVIYEKAPSHVCPFCGCEYFDAPGAPREDLDHYLVESKYPFAAANLRNLVPMGSKCNSRYKLADDILFKDDGTRRKSFFPYQHTEIRVSLQNSEPFKGKDGLHPEWKINFEPDSEEASTWDEVFHIRERYERDILDANFRSWLQEFSSWCKSALIAPVSDEAIINAIKQYSEHLETMQIRDRAFLKAAVFRMVFHHCQAGNQRLFGLIQGLVVDRMS